MFQRLAVIGVGLIGGSVARAARQCGQVTTVVGFDAEQKNLDAALALDVIQEKAFSIEAAVRDADLILLAVPMLAMSPALQSLAACDIRPDQIITDVGSVKQFFLKTVEAAMGTVPANVVPGHPIAGSERHGVTASRAELFVQHKVILTPVAETSESAVEAVSAFWQALGANVICMDPAHHDEILAQTSHLPHLLAYALVDTLSSQGDSLEVFQYAAGGFRDFSRIAASDPTMWRDIFYTNREPVLTILNRFMADLDEIRLLIEQNKMDELAEVFSRAKVARDHFSDLGNL